MKPAVRQLLFGSQFTPAKLFLGDAPGLWFDRQDLSTMYQDSAGTTACAAGSPEGLALDKSKGAVRGADMFSDADATFTGESSRVSSGVYRIFTSAGVSSGVFTPVGRAAVAGNWYEVTFNIDSITTVGGGVVPELGTGLTPATTLGPKRFIFQANASASIGIKRGTAVATDIQISAVSVRPIPGNHATQGTSPSRPLLQQDAGGRYYNAPDGFDDSHTSASGGGASAGFFFCAAITVLGGAGTVRTIWSDAGTNTGYRVRINAANQLEFSAGNGVAFTPVATGATLPVGERHVITAWDDGSFLKVQIDSGTVASVARPVVSAGTAAFTLYKDNGAASSFANVGDYVMVYRGSAPTATEIARTQRYAAGKGGVTL